MKLKKLLLALSFSVPLSLLQAQDTHFTQFNYVPLSINAAQTGLYEGTYRITALYRTQWNGGVQNGYQTPVLGVDVPLNGFRKQDWIGIGGTVHQDKAGLSALTNSLAALNAAYHIGIDKKMNQVLSVGVQVGFVSRRINRDVLRFQDQIVSGTQSQDLNAIDAQAKNYTDYSFGLNYRNKISKKQTLNVGVSLEHALAPKYNLISTTTSKLPQRLNVYATMDIALNQRLALYPGFIFRTAAGATETMLQAVAGMKIDPKKNLNLRGGLGYRVGDAAQMLVGLDWGDFRVGASYDLTTRSVLRSNSVRDGFELAVGYVGKIFKKPTLPPVILCPKY